MAHLDSIDLKAEESISVEQQNLSRKDPIFIDPESLNIRYTLIDSIGALEKSINVFDLKWSKALQKRRSSVLEKLMILLSRSGDGYLYFLFGMVVMLVDLDLGLTLSYVALTAFAIQIPVQKLLKKTLKRERPFSSGNGINRLILPPDLYSFPSGHTAGAAVMAVVTPIVFGANLMGVYAALILALWAVGVGISRIYNGVHYTSDVIAGAVLGIISALISVAIHGQF
ncbi:MAG: hypothetical protein Kapaf2KO_19430 [Candidatus Kapaibacteriales bacterium]